MSDLLIVQLSVEEFCQSAELTAEHLRKLVEHGIVQPFGETPAQWLFDVDALALAKRALRLHRDLQVQWAGVALALELMDELEHLRSENTQLRQRLSRFELE
jgi:chaperone modulatory protein CbpM